MITYIAVCLKLPVLSSSSIQYASTQDVTYSIDPNCGLKSLCGTFFTLSQLLLMLNLHLVFFCLPSSVVEQKRHQ